MGENPLYPNGRCNTCGFGLFDEYDGFVCRNADCSVGRTLVERELADLEAIFVANGGRGVDIAEQIDELRERLAGGAP